MSTYVWHFVPSALMHKKQVHNQQMTEQHFHYKLSCSTTLIELVKNQNEMAANKS